MKYLIRLFYSTDMGFFGTSGLFLHIPNKGLYFNVIYLAMCKTSSCNYVRFDILHDQIDHIKTSVFHPP